MQDYFTVQLLDVARLPEQVGIPEAELASVLEQARVPIYTEGDQRGITSTA